jgi:hypothetical protein
VPRSKKGKKAPGNLVAACRSCKVLKGNRHVFGSFEEANEHVLKRRAALRKEPCQAGPKQENLSNRDAYAVTYLLHGKIPARR